MNKKLFTCFILLLWTSLAFAGNATDDAAELGKLLQATSSLKANFIQKVYNKKQQVIRSLHGSMALKKPKLFRWQVEKPEKNLIVIDGVKFWNFDIELEQVSVQKIDASYDSSPVSLFLAADINDISKRYAIKKISGVDSNNQSKESYELKAKQATDGFKKVELIFKAGVIDSLILIDQMQQKSEIKFYNVAANLNLDQDLFIFTVPKGVDVVGDK